MATFIRPKRWFSQPPPGAQIDFGHPLAAGLTFYIVFNQGGGFQKALLPLNLPGTLSSGSNPVPSWNAGPGGLSRNFAPAGVPTVSDWYERGPWVEPSTKMTAMGRVRRVGAGSGKLHPFLKPFNNAASSPFISWNPVELNPSGGGNDTILSAICTGGTLHAGSVATLTAGTTAKEFTGGMTYDGANLITWVNGINVISTGVSGTISYDTTSTGRLVLAGPSSAGVGDWPGNIFWFGVWNKALNANSIAWLHAEPYAMLVPSQKKRFFLFSRANRIPVIRRPKVLHNQPPLGAQINFGHPLARGLSFYLLYNKQGGPPTALLPSNLTATSIGTVPAPAWKVGPGGYTPNYNGAFSYWFERGAFCEPNWLTVVSRVRRTGTLTQSAGTLGKSSHNGGSSPFISYGVVGNPGGANSDQFLCQFSDNTNTLRSGATISPGSLLNICTLGMTVGPNGSSADLKSYFNGFVKDTSNFASVTGLGYDATTTGRLIASGNSTAASSNQWNGEIYYSAVWNRALSASEMQWLHAEPYALLLPHRRRKYSFLSNSLIASRRPVVFFLE